ncbi:hypothetical protein VTN77DRAFT_4788 [Rasamsonia byssochlamydoides]|uniref:uncharacterized protein n=1 Tax=Rasamsonia byssochlamydoides TaxID=89139 RepID=UPI003742D9DE
MVALYLRLASNNNHIRFLYGFWTVVFLHGIAATIVGLPSGLESDMLTRECIQTTIFLCTLISILWSPTFPVGCINILNFNYFNAAFHITTDILLAVLPIYLKETPNHSSTEDRFVYCLRSRSPDHLRDDRQTGTGPPPNSAPVSKSIWVSSCASVPAMRSLFKVSFGGSTKEASNSFELEHNVGNGGGGVRHGHAVSRSSKFNKLDAGRTKTHIFSRTSSASNKSEKGIIPRQKDAALQTTDIHISYSRTSHPDD